MYRSKSMGSISTILVVLMFIVFTITSQASSAQINATTAPQIISSFPDSFKELINKSRNLTQSYQNETGKFANGQYDNKTMIAITNNYLPIFQNLINESKILQTTEQYHNASILYTKSLEAELQSYVHFRNYLSTGNPTESEASTKSLVDAFNYENESFNAFRSPK